MLYICWFSLYLCTLVICNASYISCSAETSYIVCHCDLFIQEIKSQMLCNTLSFSNKVHFCS